VCKFIFYYFTVVAQGGRSSIIAHPGQDVEILCDLPSNLTSNLASNETIAWTVNSVRPYGLNALLNDILDGHSSNGRNIIVENIMMNDSRNGSYYRCVITQDRTTIVHGGNLIFLYVAGEYQYAIELFKLLYMHIFMQ